MQVSEPDTISLAQSFLQSIAPKSPHLFILGDLVEYWIGDDADDGSLDAVFDDIQRLGNSGTSITLMHGNRDFLLGQEFATRIGATLVTDDFFLFSQCHSSVLLMHGDTLCTDDHAYQTMRTQLRSIDWQQAFLAKPVVERRAFADSLRQQSQTLSARKEHGIMDVNAQTVDDVLAKFGVHTLVHGHTHKPATHQFSTTAAQAATRHVLGDWHADHAIYGIMENGEIRLERFELDAP